MGRPFFQNLSPSPHRTTNRGREGQHEDRSPSSVKRPRFVHVEDILRDELSPPSSFRNLARLFYPDVEDDESDSGAHDDDVEDGESDSGTRDDDDHDDDDVESASPEEPDESSASSPEEPDESSPSPTEATASSRTRDSESDLADCPEAKIEDEAEEEEEKEITDEMVISYFLTPIQGNSRGTTTTTNDDSNEREKDNSSEREKH